MSIGIGDVVYLKNDMARAVPMVVVEIGDLGSISLQWFGRDMQIISRSFPLEVLCTGLPAEKSKEYSTFDLLRAGKFFGLYGYDSLIAQNLAGSTDFASETRLVYEFKRNNAKVKFFEERVRMVACGLGCSDIVAVPPHLPTANNLQLIFGETIRRVKEVQARKYTHKEALPTDYAESYLIDVGKILGKRVLLVDDIITSGATITHFAETLEALGYEVVLFGLGLRKTLKPEIDRRFCFVV